MHRFLQKLKTFFTGTTFGSSGFELRNFFCGIGESKILDRQIKITKYPFKPSVVYPSKLIDANEIDAVSWDSYPPLLRIKDECIFISREYSDELKKFAENNKLETFEANRSWGWILEPFLDTEHTKEDHERLFDMLAEKGIKKEEVQSLRKEVHDQMMKYNFDTMLWEWAGLGMSDVLAAMRVKYKEEEFRDFYWRAMELQLRSE